jgi:hypothetical protein
MDSVGAMFQECNHFTAQLTLQELLGESSMDHNQNVHHVV